MNLYVKMFLVTAIPFALFAVLALGIAVGFRETVVPGLMVGLAFGLLMTAILGTLDWWCMRRSATGGTRGPKQSVTLEMDPPAAAVFEKCERALSEIGAEIEILQRDRNFLEATTDYTWRSWARSFRSTSAIGTAGRSTCGSPARRR